jgi:hypothetical protein
MMGIDSPAPVAEAPTESQDPPEHRTLRAAAQLAGTAILAGGIATVACWILGLGVPILFFVVGSYWMLVPPASAVGGIAGGAAVGVSRALGCSVLVERIAVPIAAAAGSVPTLLALDAVLGDGLLGVWWLWVGIATAAAAVGHMRVLRHPASDWRSVLVRLLFGLGLATATLTVMTWGLAHFWAAFFDVEPIPFVHVGPAIGLTIAGVLGLVALLISLGPFASRTTAALAWSSVVLLTASIVAVILGVALQSGFRDQTRPSSSPLPTAWAGDPADRDPTTDLPRDPAAAEVPPPTLDEGRAQFAALAAATVDAAGPDARWRDEPGAVVREIDCGDGGTMLRIDAEFAMGEITDTTTDEHDRTVTEANLVAADRIVLAWSAAGLGTPEVLHGEPILGGADVSAVDWAKIDFAFGVAQPRIEGRCLRNR